MRFLVLGDIVGKPGRRILANMLEKFRVQHAVDFVVANAENSAGGSGITASIADKLFKYGVNVLTGGDHYAKNPASKEALEKYKHIIRPANYPDSVGGLGSVMLEQDGVCIAVLNVQGKVFMHAELDCPYETVDHLISEVETFADIIVVDMHAEATSEKIAMGWHLDGRVAIVVGTHTHVPTADERILPQGTAYITDLGMVGPYDSVIGRNKDRVLKAFVHKEKTAFHVADGDVQMRGILVDVDPGTGKATAIQRICLREDDPLAERRLEDIKLEKGILPQHPPSPAQQA